MSIQLPHPIETYFHASNVYDSELLAECFSNYVVVNGEGKEYNGPTAIKKHIIETNNKLQVKTEVTNAVEQNNESESS